VALFIGVGLTLGDPAGATQMASGSGVSHRHVSHDPFVRMVARADNGDARAQTGLALAYLRGEKIGTNPRAALHWAGQAAKAGDPLGQYLVGTLYHQGEGVAVDYKLAFRWFTAAAERGNIKAMHNLAIAYAEGLGTRRDAAKAAQWFAQAAEHGYVDSAFDLAVLFERGDGVPQDPVQALKWYQVAAALGDQPSRERADMLRHQMNHREIALADSQARQFQKLTPLTSANRLAAF
jgi:localization factor PodJL